MSGEMRLGKRWLRFTAEQILRAGVGFVWRAVVGGRIVRFVGADIMSPDLALMEFRVHGVVPVVRASGQHVTRSAAGRLAAETATWLPQALTPQMGAAWTPLDDQRATVTLGAGNETVDVDIDVDTDGRLVSVGLQRWNGSRKPPGLERFGGEFERDFVTSDGVRIGSGCRVGWGWGTPSWPQGMFFRAGVTAADRPGPTGPGDESTAIDRSEH